jgi:formylglycine-generating enzyme required for sulfatase activity
MLKTLPLFFLIALLTACESTSINEPAQGRNQSPLQGPTPISVKAPFTAGDVAATSVNTVVNFPRMFALDETEVTVGQYGDCVTAGSCTTPDTSTDCNWAVGGRSSHPINCVDYSQAVVYCAWAGKRLPTRHEWEYAARSNDGRMYPWGSSTSGLDTKLNSSVGGDGYSTTAPVGSFPGGDTPSGLKDMSGNVYEWTQSVRCEWEEGPCTNCPNDETCDNACDVCGGSSDRAIKGGSYNHTLTYARLPYVTTATVTSQSPTIGFRCALTTR